MLDLPTPDARKLPDVVLSGQGASLAQTQLTTADNVRYVMGECGFRIRLNMMTGSAELYHESLEDNSPQGQSTMEMLLLDMFARMKMKSRDTAREILAVMAQAAPYHPMEEYMKGLKWDGVDRITTLAQSITTDTPLWPIYLENWLVQTVEGVCGWRGKQKASMPHVLVLVGGQGVGKSYWLRQLGNGWFKGEAELHLSSSSGKDHQIEALKYPMVELAELDGIFRKSDISHMKAFISRDEDSIRAPYGRKALVRPRMTSFCGSVNDAEFLNDPTGSRRFWPVSVEAIDRSMVMDFDQLWAQAYTFWCEEPSFNLTPEQDEERAALSLAEHFIESDESEMIREYIRLHNRNNKFPVLAMSALDVLQMLFGKQRGFNNKQKADASRALRDIIGRNRTIEGKQRAWMVPYNEFAYDKSFWPDKISLK